MVLESLGVFVFVGCFPWAPGRLPYPPAYFRVCVFVAVFLSTEASLYAQSFACAQRLVPAVFEDAFYFVLVPPPPGGPGEGPDCHFPKGIVGLGRIPARIRGVIYF